MSFLKFEFKIPTINAPRAASTQKAASLKRFSGSMPGSGGFNPNITHTPKKSAARKASVKRRSNVKSVLPSVPKLSSGKKKGGWGWGGGGKR